MCPMLNFTILGEDKKLTEHILAEIMRIGNRLVIALPTVYSLTKSRDNSFNPLYYPFNI